MKLINTNLSAFRPQAQQTIEDVLRPTSPNLYLTRKADAVLEVTTPLGPLRSYQFPSPVGFYSGNLSFDKLLLHPNTKVALESTGLVADFGGKVFDVGHPDVAVAFQGVSVFIGAYGCIEKMMKPNEYGRTRRVFCFADLAMSVLIFLGQFIPPLKNASTAFLGIKLAVRVGDKIVERTYKAREPEGRLLLQAIQSVPAAAAAPA
jgi:hypothetical protein